MEQVDSIRSELQNLSRLQSEQIGILQKMSNSNQTEKAIEHARDLSQKTQFNTPSMYQEAAGKRFQPVTSPNYGIANPMPFGPQSISMTNGLGTEFVSNASSTFGANGKFGFIGRVNPGTSYSLTSRDLIGMDHSGRVSQAIVSGAGTLGSIGVSIGASSIVGGIGGLFGGVAAGAGVGLLANKSIDEIKKQTSLKKYLYKNSRKFINPDESTNKRGISGFSREQSGEAADFVRTMNDEFYMKDEETMLLLQKYTDGGLLKDSKDLETFKEKMTSLTKTVKESALMLDETYENIADFMSELKKAGVDQKDWKSLISGSAVLGDLNGKTGKELAETVLQFALNLNAGTGNSNSVTIDRAQEMMVYVTDYFETLKEKELNGQSLTHEELSNKDMINNLGGTVEASKFLTSTVTTMAGEESFTKPALYFFDYNSEQKDFDINKDKLNSYLKGEVSYRDALAETERKLQSYEKNNQGDAILKWENNAESYINRYLKGDDLSNALASTVQMLVDDPEMKAQGFDDRTILSNYFKVKEPDVQNLLSGIWGHTSENPNLLKKFHLQSAWNQTTAKAITETPSFTEWAGSKLESFGDAITSPFTQMNDSLGNWIQKVSDKITGLSDKIPERMDKEFSTKSDLESVSFDAIVRENKQTNDLLSVGFAGLQSIAEKGYTINSELMGDLRNRFNSSTNNVEYKRELISNWGEVSKEISDNKGGVVEYARQNSLSETIVAALYKYNEGRADNEKLEVSSTVTELGKHNFNYGGNIQLGVAATFAGKDVVDSKLNEMGYNLSALRNAGAQEILSDISFDKLELSEEINNKINEILNANLSNRPNSSGSTKVTGGATLTTKEQVVNHDLGVSSNITADQLNEFIAGKVNGRNSKMTGMGEVILEASKEFGIDPLFAVAQMGNESKWGTSNIVRDKNNFNGWGAIDSDPYNGAHAYSSAEVGVRKAIENVSKYYIHGRENQNTLYKFNRSQSGTHNYTGTNDPSEYEKVISDIMLDGIRKYGLVYGGVEQITDDDGNVVYSGHGIATTSEEVSKDKDGNTVQKSPKIKTREELLEVALEVGESDSITKGRNNFLNESSKIESLYREAETINSKKKDSDINSSKKDVNFTFDQIALTGGLSNGADEGEVRRKINSYLERYSNTDSDVENQKKLISDRNELLSFFKPRQLGWIEKELKEAEDNINTYSDKAKKKRQFAKDTDILDSFGRNYMGLNPDDYMDNYSEYNHQVMSGANRFYSGRIIGLKDFINGDKESAHGKEWGKLSLDEKVGTLKTLESLESALGKDNLDGIKSGDMEHDFDTVYEFKYAASKKGSSKTFEEQVLDDDELQVLDKLKKKDGQLVYDPTYSAKESGKRVTVNDFASWKEKGSLVDNNAFIRSELEDMGISPDKLSEDASIKETMDIINQSMDEVKIQNREKVREAMDASNLIVTDSGNSEFGHLSKEQREGLSQAIRTGDYKYIESFNENNEGANIDTTRLGEYSNIAKGIAEIDLRPFQLLIDAMKSIGDVASDTAKTMNLLNGSLDETTSENYKERVLRNASEVLSGVEPEISKKIENGGDKEMSELITLLNEGGVGTIGGKTVELSSETVQALSAAMGKAIDDTVGEVLSGTNATLDEFKESGIFKAAVEQSNQSGVGVVVNKKNGEGEIVKATVGLDEAVDILKTVNGKLEENAGANKQLELDLTEEKNDLVGQISTLVQESTQEIGKTEENLAESEKKLAEAVKSAEKSASTFASTIAKYDSSISAAIDIMENRIDGIESRPPVIINQNPNVNGSIRPNG